MNDSDYGARPEEPGTHEAAAKFRRPPFLLPQACAVIRALLCLPLLCISLLFTAIAIIGVARLPAIDQAALPANYARAAETALICLILSAPAAAFRPSLLWLLPLAATASAGAAGWAVLPLPANHWMPPIEGAVLLLPVMVLVMGARWRLIPPGLAQTAATTGASPPRAFILAALRPALPGIAGGLALIFVLALGLAPLLAPAPASP